MKVTEFDSFLHIQTRPGVTHYLLLACVPMLVFAVVAHIQSGTPTSEDLAGMVMIATFLLAGILISDERESLILDRYRDECQVRIARLGVRTQLRVPMVEVLKARIEVAEVAGEDEPTYHLVVDMAEDELTLPSLGISNAEAAELVCERINTFVADRHRMLRA